MSEDTAEQQQRRELGVMPADPAAVRAACEHWQDVVDDPKSSRNSGKTFGLGGTDLAELRLILAALSARDEAREARQKSKRLAAAYTQLVESLNADPLGILKGVREITSNPSVLRRLDAVIEAGEALQSLAEMIRVGEDQSDHKFSVLLGTEDHGKRVIATHLERGGAATRSQADTPIAAITALAARLPDIAGKQAGAAGEGEMKEAGEG